MDKNHASSVYLVIRFLLSLANATMFTTYALYYINTLGLDPFELLLVGMILEVTVLVFEGITGVVADTYSRRLSVIIGMAITGAAFVLEGTIPFFGSVSFFVLLMIAEGIRGVGWTFLSGATSAWITDEVGENNVGRLFLRGNRLSLYAGLLGMAASVGLATLMPNLPYLVGGVLYLLLTLFLVFRMKETGFTPSRREAGESAGPLGNLLHTWKSGVRVVRGRPVLLMILGVTLFSGAASEGYDRLKDAQLLQVIGLPEWGISAEVWYGIFGVIATFMSLGLNKYIDSRVDLSNTQAVARSMFALTLTQIVLTIGFALAPNFLWALAAYLMISAVRTLSYPIYDTWLNQNIDSRVRATVLSMVSQSDALGQTAGGPFVGWIGSRFSIRTSLVVAGVLLTPILVVFARVLRIK